jgi:hypothetical protein
MTATERSARRREQDNLRVARMFHALERVRDEAASIGEARKIAAAALPVGSTKED